MGTMLEDIEIKLNAKTIHELRQVARAVGVNRPADGKKERIIAEMLSIAAGESDPAPRSARGAPPKSNEYDRQLVSEIERCREISLARKGGLSDGQTLTVRNPETQNEDGECGGFLEMRDGKWFMRDSSDPSPFADVFVHVSFITRFNLREGDYVCGVVKGSKGELRGLVSVISVNGNLPDAYLQRREYSQLTPVYPDRKLNLCGDGALSKVINLISPLAAGQRAFITGASGDGMTSLLRDIAEAAGKNGNVSITVLLADGRPEDETAFRRAAPEVKVFTPALWGNDCVRCANAALACAKRQTEFSRDSLLIVDNFTHLCKSFDYSMQVTASLSANALAAAKSFLLSAINAEEGGSLTILSALLLPSGERVNDAVYYGLNDLCNMRVALSSKLARSHIYPPVDIANSGADNEQNLLSEKELKALINLRNSGLDDDGILTIFANSDYDGIIKKFTEI